MRTALATVQPQQIKTQ